MAILVARTNLPVWDFQKLASLLCTASSMLVFSGLPNFTEMWHTYIYGFTQRLRGFAKLKKFQKSKKKLDRAQPAHPPTHSKKKLFLETHHGQTTQITMALKVILAYWKVKTPCTWGMYKLMSSLNRKKY